MSKQVSICVIGSGYVGLVAAVCFAEIGHKVVCVDNNEAKVKQLREGGVPIYEHHLPELLGKHLNRGVEFTTDLAAAVEQSEAIFIAVGTPQGNTGSADFGVIVIPIDEGKSPSPEAGTSGKSLLHRSQQRIPPTCSSAMS